MRSWSIVDNASPAPAELPNRIIRLGSVPRSSRAADGVLEGSRIRVRRRETVRDVIGVAARGVRDIGRRASLEAWASCDEAAAVEAQDRPEHRLIRSVALRGDTPEIDGVDLEPSAGNPAERRGEFAASWSQEVQVVCGGRDDGSGDGGESFLAPRPARARGSVHESSPHGARRGADPDGNPACSEASPTDRRRKCHTTTSVLIAWSRFVRIRKWCRTRF